MIDAQARLYVALAGLALVAAACAGSWWHGRGVGKAQEARNTVKVQAEWVVERSRLIRVAEDERAKRKAIEDGLAAQHKEIVDEAERKAADAADATAAAAAAGERLRQRVASLTISAARGCRPVADPASAQPGAPAEAAGVLADLPGRLEAEGRRYSDIAETALTRGETCERSYDAAYESLSGGAP